VLNVIWSFCNSGLEENLQVKQLFAICFVFVGNVVRGKYLEEG
jgi:hypothetical protein